MLSADDVRKALDLIPFEGFARKQDQVLEHAKEGVNELYELQPHHTGRTTRMLCSLLAVASTGRRVAIYAKPFELEADLKAIARSWAERIGINPEMIVGRLATADVEFFDHTWYES